MSRTAAKLGVTALVCAVAAAPLVAVADEGDDADVRSEGFWAEVAHPHRGQYAELISQGATFLQSNDPATASQFLEQAVKLDGTEPMGFYLLGVAAYRQKRFDA